MELVTTGREIYPDYQVKMYFNKNQLEQDKGQRYKIIYIKAGTGFIKVGDNRSFIMAPTLCCLNEKEMLQFENQQNVELLSLYFHPDVINRKLNFDNINTNSQLLTESDYQDRWCMKPFYNRYQNYNGIITLEPAVSKHVEELLLRIGSELTLQRDDSWPCRSRSFLIELMYLLRKIYDNPSTPAETNIQSLELTDPIVMYIHLNYTKKITLNDLSKQFLTNKTTLNRNFKKATGYTVMDYLNKLRIGMACTMLRNTNLSISEILYIIGFKDDAHFGRIFKKYTGFIPSAYRKSMSS